MIDHKYGTFSYPQIDEYKTKMRKKIFWLVLYTDENTNQDYKHVDVVQYQENLMSQLAGLNSLLSYPVELVEMLSILEEALAVLKSDDFNFKRYKKLVFDAGAIIQHMKVGDTSERV